MALVVGVAFWAFSSFTEAVHAKAAPSEIDARAHAIDAGAKTRGGVTSDARIFTVTSLADSGAGSLRAAIEATGPRVWWCLKLAVSSS